MNIVSIATSDYIGFVLLVAMLISSRIRRSDETHVEFRIFTVITMVSMAACFVDFFAFYADGKSGTFWKIINLLSNTFCFIANPFFASCWCLYEELKLYRSKKRVRKIYTYAFIPAAIMVVLALINLFVPIVFSIDENNIYHRLPLSYFYYVVDMGYIFFSIYILRKYEERYGKVRFFPLYLMIGPVVLGVALQTLFYGISLMWVSVAVGLTAIYMSLQNEFSYLDKLTGLYNRAYLDYYLETISKDSDARLGGVMIDVDYFKTINDTLGHHTGDEALVDVARIVTFAKPDKAVATRFAGDEFILLVKGASDKQMQSIVKNIHDEVEVFNDTESREYKLSLSVGYATYDPKIDTMDEFLKKMDDNMYQEKDTKHRR